MIHLLKIGTIEAMDKTLGQPEVKQSLLRSISLKNQPELPSAYVVLTGNFGTFLRRLAFASASLLLYGSFYWNNLALVVHCRYNILLEENSPSFVGHLQRYLYICVHLFNIF